ncbi:MAG: head GIN domain-containing protein [Bacteroidota bacterium]
MKNWIFLFAFLVIGFTACQEDESEIVGSDVIISEDRDEAEFDRIDVSSIINVNVTYDLTQTIVVTANDNIIDRVNTVVGANTLSISLQDGSYDNVTITVDITIPDLRAIQNEGTGNVNINDFLNLDDLSIESIGTGSINAQGSADKLSIELTGTGSFKGFDFITKTTDADLTGTGNIEIHCTDKLEGSITGTGSIFYRGNPDVDVSITGTGSVIDSN